MNFSFSTFNYLSRPELTNITGFRRANALRYNFCPGVEDDLLSTITIKNVSGTPMHVGALAFGNVKSSSTANNTISATVSIGLTTVASAVKFYGEDSDYVSTYDQYPHLSHAKLVTVLLDNQNLTLQPLETLVVTFSQPVRAGWIWFGNLITFLRGISNPTKVELDHESKLIELENGDKLRELGLTRRKITCSLSGMNDTDRSTIQNNLFNGELYLISGFNPMATSVASPELVSYTDEWYNKVMLWKEFTALTRLTNNASFNTQIHGIYASSLTFTEVM